MPPASYFAPDHEAGDVLQEDQRDLALAAQLDEMRALQRAFGKQHAIVGDDADRHAVQMRKAGDQRRAVVLLELVELGAVDDARDDLAHIIGLARVARDDAVDLRRIVKRRRRFLQVERLRSCCRFRFLTMRRAIASACSSSSA